MVAPVPMAPLRNALARLENRIEEVAAQRSDERASDHATSIDAKIASVEAGNDIRFDALRGDLTVQLEALKTEDAKRAAAESLAATKLAELREDFAIQFEELKADTTGVATFEAPAEARFAELQEDFAVQIAELKTELAAKASSRMLAGAAVMLILIVLAVLAYGANRGNADLSAQNASDPLVNAQQQSDVEEDKVEAPPRHHRGRK